VKEGSKKEIKKALRAVREEKLRAGRRLYASKRLRGGE